MATPVKTQDVAVIAETRDAPGAGQEVNTDTATSGAPVYTAILDWNGEVDLSKAQTGRSWEPYFRIMGRERAVPAAETLLQVYPKGTLHNWMLEQIAAGWMKNPELLAGVDTYEAVRRVRQLTWQTGEYNRRRAGAARSGLDVLLGEATKETRRAEAENVTTKKLERIPEARIDLVAVVELLDALDAEVIARNALIWHVPETDETVDELCYAGTLDLLLELPSDGRVASELGWESDEPMRVVADLRTGTPYNDAGLQLAAYSNATHLVQPDGTVVPMPTIHHAIALRYQDGTAEWKRVDLSRAWEHFKDIARVWLNHNRFEGGILSNVSGFGKVGPRENLRNSLNGYMQRGVPKAVLEELLPDGFEHLNLEGIRGAHIALDNQATRLERYTLAKPAQPEPVEPGEAEPEPGEAQPELDNPGEAEPEPDNPGEAEPEPDNPDGAEPELDGECENTL